MHDERNAHASERAAQLALATLLAAALLFGGGPQGQGDLLVHLAAVPCLTLAIRRWPQHPGRAQRLLGWWCLAALALAAAQLLPLPAALWTRLPLRAELADSLQLAGLPIGARPFSLDPWASVRALLALAVFASAALLASTLSPHARQRLVQGVLLLVLVQALLGFAQAAAGERAWRAYDFHHGMGAIGLFANRNHFASLLGMLVPLALLQAWRASRGASSAAPSTALAWHGVALLLLLASALSFSRAGFALTLAATLVTLAVLHAPRRGTGRRGVFAGVTFAATAASAIGVYAWDGLLQRLENDPLTDLRWQYLRYGWQAAREQFPWGGGLGAFPWLYAPHEPVPAMVQVYAARAHNDLLQVLIEAGVPGLLLVAGLLALLGVKAARKIPICSRNLLAHDPTRTVTLVAVAVPLLHSLVDYPLRTLAVATVMALLLSMRLAPIGTPQAAHAA